MAVLPTPSAPTAVGGTVVASDLTGGASVNLVSYANAFTDAFSSSGDGAQIYDRDASPSIPFAVLDDSLVTFPADTLGIVDDTNLDPFFGVTDTVNGDNPAGEVSAAWVFDIAGRSDLSISIDLGAMGDFESDDAFAFEVSIDGAAPTILFEAVVDEDAALTYTLAGGAEVSLDDPLTVGGIALTNELTEFAAAVAGAGSQLTLTFRGSTDGGSEAFAFQNIVVKSGATIEEPGAGIDAPEPSGAVRLSRVWQHDSGAGEGGSEVVQYDDGKLVTTNGADDSVDVLDAATGSLLLSIDLSALPGYDGVQSVDIKNGLIVAAIARPAVDVDLFGTTVSQSQNGFVAIFDAESGALISTADVGVLPDMITFNDDGTKVLVALEGEKNEDSDHDDDPLGGIAVIDVSDPTAPATTVLDFAAFNGFEDLAREAGVRIAPGVSFAEDMEPEYIALSPDGATAFVTLQENNAVAVLDLASMTITEVIGLGTRDYSTEGNELDANDNGIIELETFDDLVGLFMPDAVASYEVDGQTYFVTANEGDDRGWDAERVGKLADAGLIDPSVDIEGLERLAVSTVDGDLDGDGDIDVLHALNTRSFSIFAEDGTLVYDSGSLFETFIAANYPERFNDDDGEDGENRSDAKGPEPEAIEIGQAYGKTFAFIGMERDSGVFVMDITDPTNVSLVDYMPGFGAGDLAPEVIEFIPEAESSTGFAQIAVSYEVTGTTSLFNLLPDEASIGQIQGAGHMSAFEGMTVTTTGIVTAVDSNGFYLQDPEGDGDDATSDAIFVYTGSAPAVVVGDEAKVKGTVTEYVAGSGNLALTELTSPTVEVLSSGNELPAAIVIGAGGREIPDQIISDDELPVNLNEDPVHFDPTEDAIDFWESLEGMRVTVEGGAVISPTNRFDETWVVSDEGAGTTPGLTDRGVLQINADADGYGDLNPERIQLQYDSGLLPDGFDAPDLNVGDILSDVTGVVGYDFGNYQIAVTEEFTVETPSTNAPEVSELEGTSDKLSVATFNVLNLTSATGTGDSDDDDAAQIQALAQQIVANLNSPDIIGLQEIQDNSGVSDGLMDGIVAADETLQALIDAIVAAGGPEYSFIDSDYGTEQSHGGVPGGNIRNAFLYNAERVDLVASETLDAEALAAYGVSDPDAFAGTREPLLAVFSFDGEEIVLINNHFPSRSGSDPIFGAEQPFEQGGEADREAASKAVNEVVDALVAANADAKVVVMGDLNTFEFTDEVAEDLAGTGAEKVLTHLAEFAEEGDVWSYIFDGNAQALDHILATSNLLGGVEVDYVHVNADQAQQASDHDPVLALFDFGFVPGEVIVGGNGKQELIGTAGDDFIYGKNGKDLLKGLAGDDALYGGRGKDDLRGGAGDDLLVGGLGKDLMTGGEGEDVFVVQRKGGWDEITDFEAGVDTILVEGFKPAVGFEDVSFKEHKKKDYAWVIVDHDKVAKVTSDDFDHLSTDDLMFA
ncbi:choice-of-anchor I family protein [Albimonas sp. CAU 1670]|uniref:choice-of-anchor I family protein n=1 Tax=Albimonas sp. CAU 1670 TaxID=3032599 RepID=UPI0023DAF45C|nr:choice-of-anchor I family protein [Albimonas sp. CAU 1670]MDF2234596.1 choice-of-anchor I family protein [Albimonas sp. CAU 1670]